jgi:hypothetical protein
VAAHRWYQDAKSLPDHPSSLRGDMWVFFKGFASLLLPSKEGMKIPDTFMFDKERISKLRSDVLDFVNLEICVRKWRNDGQSSPSPSQTKSSLSAEESFLSSILALIEDTSWEGRWSKNCSSIALEILRLSNFEKNFEGYFNFHLSNTSSQTFRICESHVLSELYTHLLDHITHFSRLTLSQLIWRFQPSAPYRTLQDVSKHMAHIGILHWRVWAPLVYLENIENDDHRSHDTRPSLEL